MVPSILTEVILALSNMHNLSCNVYVLATENKTAMVNFAMTNLAIANAIPVFVHSREQKNVDVRYLSRDSFLTMLDYIRFRHVLSNK